MIIIVWTILLTLIQGTWSTRHTIGSFWSILRSLNHRRQLQFLIIGVIAFLSRISLPISDNFFVQDNLMYLICWTGVILMDCSSYRWVITLHQIYLIEWCSDHMSWISSTVLTIYIELVEMIRSMNYWMPCIRAVLLIWMKIMVPSIKAVNSLSSVHLMVVRAAYAIKRTVMWPNCDVRSSRVILSSVNCRTISIIACIQWVATIIHDMRLSSSIFIS